MRLRTLRLDRIGRLWAPLVAAALFLGSPSFAPAQQSGFRKSGISVSAPQFRQLISKTG